MAETTDAAPLTYDASFRREVVLSDGSEAVLRAIRPQDKDLLRRGFDALSPESRYARFFSAKIKISETELRYLTEIDGVDHFAIGVVQKKDGHDEEGLGIARFIRDADDPQLAEPALAVVDHAQGKGLGTLLLRHLTAAARERGIRQFHCELLAQNLTMAHLLEEISPDMSLKNVGIGIIEATVPLPGAGPDRPPHEVRDTAMHRLLAQVAEEKIDVPLGRRLLAYLGIEREK